MQTEPQTQTKPTLDSPNLDATALLLAVPPPRPLAAAPMASPPVPEAGQARASKPRTRIGKIARLAVVYRDMVCRMLQQNVAHSEIKEALGEYGIKVTERNISNWKTRGGYQEWREEQERAVQLRLLQDNMSEYLRRSDASVLPEVGLQLAATQLSQFFLRPEAVQQLVSDPEAYSRLVATLCRLSGQIRALQQRRDEVGGELGTRNDPARVRAELEESVDSTRETYSKAKITDDFEVLPHRNFIPRNKD